MHCICGLIKAVANRTPVTVLQHPRERRHPIGTARLLRLGLSQVDIQVCWDLQPRPLPEYIGVLYPHPRAQALESLPIAGRPQHLVVLDGTWHQAGKLHQANPWLQRLPHYSITPDAIDRYRIRREPASYCTSTLEAVVQALKVLEPETPGFEALLQAFTTMIDWQIARAHGEHAIRRCSKRPRQRRGPIPGIWHDAYRQLVLLYAEYTPYLRADGRRARELLYMTAYYPATDEVFSFVLKPTQPLPSPSLLGHMGLTAEALQQGGSLTELRAAWEAFAPRGAHLLAWSQAALDLASTHLAPGAPTHLLKAVVCNLWHRSCGHIEAVVAAQGLQATPLPVTGRAGPRLGAARAVLHWLLQRQPAPCQIIHPAKASSALTDAAKAEPNHPDQALRPAVLPAPSALAGHGFRKPG